LKYKNELTREMLFPVVSSVGCRGFYTRKQNSAKAF